MQSLSTPFALGLTALVVGLAGCTGENATNGPETSPPPPTVDMHDGHGHAHPSEGPHHGDLIELGSEDYHAELVHDDETGTVTIYLLDAAATQPVAIEAGEITINARHDGRPMQFKLNASPQEGDAVGSASRFISSDAELAEVLDHDGSDAKLAVTISGKSYTGRLEHSHGDHGHDHAH